MVVAVTALVFAVGGTAFAAASLPANSVGTKQLKRSAVTTKKIHARAITGAKVAVNTLTGLNIRESSLATVPSATLAGNAGKLNGLPAASLTRIAFTPTSSDITLTGATATKDMSSVTLTAPVKGFVRVFVTGNGIAIGSTGCPCAMQGRLRADAGSDLRVFNTNLAGDAGDLVGGADRRGVAGTTVFPVDAGPHTFTFSVFRQVGLTTSTIGMSNVTLEAEFMPFDGSGAAPTSARLHAHTAATAGAGSNG
jgi:hypothetical protein